MTELLRIKDRLERLESARMWTGPICGSVLQEHPGTPVGAARDRCALLRGGGGPTSGPNAENMRDTQTSV